MSSAAAVIVLIVTAWVVASVNRGIRMLSDIQAKLDAIKAQVERETTVEASATTLINALSKQIADLKSAASSTTTDPAVLQAIDDLSNTLSSNADGLGAAVTANTPVDPSATGTTTGS